MPADLFSTYDLSASLLDGAVGQAVELFHASKSSGMVRESPSTCSGLGIQSQVKT